MEAQILVVDGTATSRITLKVRLAAACYDPLMARSGAEALDALTRSRPSLVLIGGAPDDMGAIDLCTRILAVDPSLPVLMVVARDQRIAALRAGAAAVLDLPIDELVLFARIRGLMRNQARGPDAAPRPGLAEEPALYLPPAAAARSGLLIAGEGGAAVCWRGALAARLAADLRVIDPDRALAEAVLGMVPDLYLIAADMVQPGDGLRLLSELRSRRSSRNAAFAVVLEPGREDMTSVALDLGAGDVLNANFPNGDGAVEAALRLTALIRRKLSADRRRAAEQRERSLAWLDPLTGLANRRFALPRLTELCRGTDDGGACTVIALDIDNFKSVNDSFGHAAGDIVLSEVAARLEQVVAAPGFVARVGGEEFLAVLPDAGEAEAVALAQRLRACVSDAPIRLPGQGRALQVTISAGVAGLHRGPADTPTRVAKMLERADEALLRAKRAGRNRLILWGHDMAA